MLAVELSAVLARYRPRLVKHVNEIVKHVNPVGYEELHETAFDIALSTGCRAVDAFFISCAKETNSILISSDEVQISNARKAGVEAYHLLEEYNKLLVKLRKL
ncbi:PIN domain-containing protein [Candidatus Bathyarchaeota archaeon]|nr:MAG: PIN domain-containing protein [Candidatus Bathyarchaeota archaeon]